MLVITGSAHPTLAARVAEELHVELARRVLGRFPDGEPHVELQADVRGRPVAIIQPLRPPVGEHVLELLLLADACRRGGAHPITAVVPYLGLARQDRVGQEGQPLGLRVLAEALETAPISRVVLLDPHSPASLAVFHAPVVELTAVRLLAHRIEARLDEPAVVVSPDLGAMKLAGAYARILRLPLAAIQKARLSSEEVEVRGVLGDVEGRRPVIVDDMISTGATVVAAVEALMARGCKPEITVVATHGLFSQRAFALLGRPEIRQVLTTDSVPLGERLPAVHAVAPLAPLLADALRRIGTPAPRR